MWFLILLTIILALVSLWRRKEPITAMGEVITGVIKELPMLEANRKNLPVEVLSLARAMQSEESGTLPRTAVGHAVKNHANTLKLSITALVTTTSKKSDGSHAFPEVRGHYSQQRFAKYCSTFAAPTDATIDLARRVIDGSVADPTGGAEKFDNPTLQDLLAKASPYDEETKKGYHTSEEILAKRTLEGYTAVAIEGTSTRFWVKS
jgi:hypothetical protein